MSLIFDRFPSRENAENFRDWVERAYGLSGQIFDDEATAYEHDWFPWQLDPPIVHIDRPDLDDASKIESMIEKAVVLFGGTFAGT